MLHDKRKHLYLICFYHKTQRELALRRYLIHISYSVQHEAQTFKGPSECRFWLDSPRLQSMEAHVIERRRLVAFRQLQKKRESSLAVNQSGMRDLNDVMGILLGISQNSYGTLSEELRQSQMPLSVNPEIIRQFRCGN